MPADGLQGPRCIAITGASAGLGAALARHYAAPGRVLGLLARRPQALEAVAADCRARGAEVVTACGDVAEADGVRRWLAAVDARGGLDLAVANAGTFDGVAAGALLEDDAAAAGVIRTNLSGAIVTAGAAAALMQPRRIGQIALIASLAARHPLADAPVYSASKAGLLAYGEALRERLAEHGITVSLVLPGHVDTAQVARHRGALPGLMSAEAAAGRIARGLARRQGTIAFPARLAWLIAAGRLLPWRLRARVARGQRFSVDPPETVDPGTAIHGLETNSTIT